MISKEEAKAKLRKAGYTVVDDNSVITVVISDKGNIKNTVKTVKELFLKIDYNASFGVKQSANSIVGDGAEDDADTDEAILTEDESALDEDLTSESSDIDNNLAGLSGADNNIAESAGKNDNTSSGNSKKAQKKQNSKNTTDELEEDEFFDEEDDIESDGDINLDSLDMDMLLNEDSIQFSLEDFGMM